MIITADRATSKFSDFYLIVSKRLLALLRDMVERNIFSLEPLA